VLRACWLDQRGQTLISSRGVKHNCVAAIGLALGQATDELFVAELLEPLQAEGWASAMA
jgi:hypothetical protein